MPHRIQYKQLIFDGNQKVYALQMVSTRPQLRGGASLSEAITSTSSFGGNYGTTSKATSRTIIGTSLDQSYLFTQKLPTISQHTFGKFDTAKPAIQDGLGTSGNMYANFTGMLLPIMGANLGTGRFNAVNQAKHQGYTPATESPVVVATASHVYTRTAWTYQNDNWQRYTTTRTGTILRADTQFSYDLELPIESVRNAFLMALTTYKYDSTEGGDPDVSFWQQNTNRIVAVTLATANNSYVLGSAQYATDATNYVSTSYSFEHSMTPLFDNITRTEFRDSAGLPLRWFSAPYKIDDKIFICGGIDVKGNPKTAYIYPYNAHTQIPIKVMDGTDTINDVLPRTGISTQGTAVTTYAYRNDYEVEIGNTGGQYAENQPYGTAFYRQHDTAWSNSRIVVHPWNIPLGGSYEYGIVTKLGVAPQTSASTLNPQADASLHRTAKVYMAGTNPETMESTKYLSESIFHTQSDAPYIN